MRIVEIITGILIAAFGLFVGFFCVLMFDAGGKRFISLFDALTFLIAFGMAGLFIYFGWSLVIKKSE